MDFFFYGTLLDSDVRRAVLGRAAERLALEPARLSGYRRIGGRRSGVPALVAHSQGAVEGLLARGIEKSELLRLDRYEGRGYRRIPVPVVTETGARLTALVYFARKQRMARGADWSLKTWQRRHKRRWQRAIVRWLAATRG